MQLIYFLKAAQAIILFFSLFLSFSDAYLRNKSCTYLRHTAEQLYIQCESDGRAKPLPTPSLHPPAVCGSASVEISSKSGSSTSQWHHARPSLHPQFFHLINEHVFTFTNSPYFLDPRSLLSTTLLSGLWI